MRGVIRPATPWRLVDIRPISRDDLDIGVSQVGRRGVKEVNVALEEGNGAGFAPPRPEAAGGDGSESSRRLHNLRGTWPRRVASFVAVTVVGAVIVQFVPDIRHSLFGSDSGFHGTILRPPTGPPDVTIRDRPTNTSRNAGTLAPGVGVVIICKARGDPVIGPSHGSAVLTSRLWDKVRLDGGHELLGFVPDALVNTGTTNPEASGC